MINEPADRSGINAMLNEAYRMKFAPATARGDAVAVSMVWLVANTTVIGRHERRHDGAACGAATAHDPRTDRAAADSRGGGHRRSQAGGHAADEAG
jgi:hypothetical protein